MPKVTVADALQEVRRAAHALVAASTMLEELREESEAARARALGREAAVLARDLMPRARTLAT